MKTRMACMAVGVALIGLMAGCGTMAVRENDEPTAVRAVLEEQVRAWNAGDLAAFMKGYAKTDQTRFASGGDITLGWQTVFDRYRKKYGTGAGMVTLHFSDVDIRSLGPASAFVFGHWDLTGGADTSSGLFTLLFRKTS